jgi:hypothetical protein
VKFETRSKEAVLVDLAEKLRTLSSGHPDRVIQERMIHGLRSEIPKSSQYPETTIERDLAERG